MTPDELVGQATKHLLESISKGIDDMPIEEKLANVILNVTRELTDISKSLMDTQPFGEANLRAVSLLIGLVAVINEFDLKRFIVMLPEA